MCQGFETTWVKRLGKIRSHGRGFDVNRTWISFNEGSSVPKTVWVCGESTSHHLLALLLNERRLAKVNTGRGEQIQPGVVMVLVVRGKEGARPGTSRLN